MSSDKDNNPPSVTGNEISRRKFRIITIIVIISFIVLGIFISFAPTFVARHIIASQLEDLGIEYEGVDTLRINPWKREVWIGPVRIRMAESDPGQLGELGIKIRFSPVFDKRAMLERVLIRGMDIFVARNQDNTITLNGIPLNKFFPTGKDPETREDKHKPWGVGLGEFELLDSRIIFKEKSGGVLTVEIDRVTLRNIRSWDPEKMGNFNLAARVNDISFNWTGEVRPFADNFTIAIDSHTNDVSLPKIIRFIGPIGFERKRGVYNIHLKLNITLSASGQLIGKSVGTLEVIGLDYEREGEFALVIERSDIDLNTQFTLSEEGRFQIDGNAVVMATKTKGSAKKDNTYSAERASVELNDLNLSFGAGSGFHLNTKPQIVIEKGEYSGTMPLSVASLLQLLRFLQSLSSGDTAAQQLAASEDFAVSKVKLPKADIKLSQLSSDSLFGLTMNKGEVSLDIDGKSELSEIQLVALDRTTTIRKLSTNLDDLEIRTGRGEWSMRIAGGIDSSGYRIKGQIGEAFAEEVKTVIQEAKLMIQPGKITLGASGSAALIGAKFLSLETNKLPRVTVSAETIMTNLKQASRVISSQQQVWDSEGEFKVDRLNIAFQKGETGSARLQKLELRGAKVDQYLHLTSDALEISSLDLFVTRQFIEKALKIRSDKSKKDDESTRHNDKESHSSLVKKIQKRLKEKGYYKGSIDGQLGPQTEAAVRAFEEISGLPLVGLATKELLAALRDAEGPSVSLAIGRIALVDGANIRFQDNTVQPAVDIETFFQIAEIQGFDSSDPAKRAKVRIVADINEFTHLELDGSVGGVGPESNFDVSGKIENIELHTYSPYTAEFGGFMLESGQLTTLSDTISKEGNLDGLLNVELQGLEFTPLTEQDQDRLSGRVGLPVETIVGFLENNEGRISLELPVGGTISKPAIDIKPAIYKGIGGILKNVFPPTLVASILISGDQGDLSFAPIKFSPGSKKLDREAKTYADNILLLLEEQPKLSLDFCGRSTYEDLAKKVGLPFKPPITSEKQDTGTKNSEGEHSTKLIRILKKYELKMNVLAVDRTSAVRSYLIKKNSVDPKRITECRPYFDVNDPGPPRVEISF